jgi:signal transduction histidine kinase
MNMRRGSTKPRRRLAPVIALLLCLLSAAPLAAAAGAESDSRPRGLLVLYWYGRDFPVNVIFDQSVQAALRSAPPGSIEYYAEYIESNRFPGENHSLLFRDYLRQRYADRRIDVVIAVSIVALDFLMKYRHDLFPNVPIVYQTLGSPAFDQKNPAANMTGVELDDIFKKTLDVALRLHPDTEEALVIVATPERDKRLEAWVREQLVGFENRITVNYVCDVELGELINRVRSTPQKSIILYVRYSQDEPGKTVDPYDAMAMVSQTSPVPVYGIFSNDGPLFNRGGLGGYSYSNSALAATTLDLAFKTINGARPEDLPVVEVTTVPLFNWRELRRWGITEDQLPAGSIVKFKAPTFWEEYRGRILGFSSVCLIEGLLILALLLERRERLKGRRKLDERLRFETLVAELSADLAAVTSEEVDSKIQTWLGTVAESIKADRGALLELSDHGTIATAWQSHGSGPYSLPEEALNSALPWYVGALRQGTTLNCFATATRLPEDARPEKLYCVKYGLKSHLAVPVWSNGSVSFAIAFTSLRASRKWSDDLATRLRLVGEIFVNALRRRNAEAALVKLNVELESRVSERTFELAAKSRELEAFAFSIAHDLKAPLRGIDGYSRLLLEYGLQKLDETSHDLLVTIRNSTMQMNQLIEDLLAYSKLERRELAIRTFELRPFLETLVNERRSEILARNIEVDIEINGLTVAADSQGLAQALRNYLENSIKFTRSTAKPRIEVGAAETEDALCIWVRDNGVGFDMQFHDRVFDIFQRLHKFGDYPGTGIGLAIARKAVERMRGRVWAQSEPGRGSVFYLEIPKPASAGPRPETQHHAAAR